MLNKNRRNERCAPLRKQRPIFEVATTDKVLNQTVGLISCLPIS